MNGGPRDETGADPLRGRWIVIRFVLLLSSGVALLVAKATLRGDMTAPAAAAVLAAGAALAAAGCDCLFLIRRRARIAAGSEIPRRLDPMDILNPVVAFAFFPLLIAIQPGMPGLGRWTTVALSVSGILLGVVAPRTLRAKQPK